MIAVFRRSWRTTIGASLLATGLAVVLAVAPSAEAVQPVLTINPVRYQIDANTSPQFKIGVAHLPSGSRTYIQRQFGSGQVWKNVLLVTKAKYIATTAKVPMGRFVYRLATIKSKKTVVTSVVRGVFGYGAVRIETLCNARDYGTVDCYSDKQPKQVGDTLFNYTVGGYGETYDTFRTLISISRSSCRYISVNYADVDRYRTTVGAYLQVVQTSTDPQTGAASPNSVQHATFTLDGGPFQMNASRPQFGYVGIVGAASCWTPSGTR